MRDVPAVDGSARPLWRRTGYTYFPFAAQVSGRWWVLRRNFDFPAHAKYTIFIDREAAADITGDPNSDVALKASVGALTLTSQLPLLDADVAQRVVAGVAEFVDYGSEVGDPCMFCASRPDPMTRRLSPRP